MGGVKCALLKTKGKKNEKKHSIKFSSCSGDVVGCGGGDTETVTTGKAFYIDSAVSGVNYKCGTQEGITDTDGSFIFEVGAGCTFYLGDIVLRSVDTEKLKDGENVYETDVEIARILQSLDSDGNANNGITIKASTIKALADHEITTLPTNASELSQMLAVIAANGGTEISEEDAGAHLTQTQTQATKELLAGKTFYVPYHENNTDTIEKHVINNDATQTSWSQVYGQNNSGVSDITIQGKEVTFHSEEENHVITIESADAKHIYLKDGEKLYLKLDDAKATFSGGGDSSSPETSNTSLEALIVGKTFYLTDETETEVSTLIFKNDGTGTFGEFPFTYVISGKSLIITGADGGDTFTNVEELTTHLRFTDANGNETGRFFFTREAAVATLN